MLKSLFLTNSLDQFARDIPDHSSCPLITLAYTSLDRRPTSQICHSLGRAVHLILDAESVNGSSGSEASDQQRPSTNVGLGPCRFQGPGRRSSHRCAADHRRFLQSSSVLRTVLRNARRSNRRSRNSAADDPPSQRRRRSHRTLVARGNARSHTSDARSNPG